MIKKMQNKSKSSYSKSKDAAYFKNHYRTFVVRFHEEYDKHVIDLINAQPKKIDYFRAVIEYWDKHHKQ